MNLFRMRGAWGGWTARFYAAVIAEGAAPLYRRFTDALDERLGPGAVLDVGCGPGHLAELLARRRPDIDVTGVDLSEAMLRQARHRAGPRPNVRFRLGDACDLPFADESFDAAYSVASIKHWPDRDRGVREMARVLRPGGMMCLVEADPGCSPESARAFTSEWRWLLPGTKPLAAAYFRRFVAGQGITPAELERYMSAAGLTDVTRVAVAEAPVGVVTGRRPTV